MAASVALVSPISNIRSSGNRLTGSRSPSATSLRIDIMPTTVAKKSSPSHRRNHLCRSRWYLVPVRRVRKAVPTDLIVVEDEAARTLNFYNGFPLPFQMLQPHAKPTGRDRTKCG